jgi:RNA polymerase sigma-70 factor (ECF subfamily)
MNISAQQRPATELEQQIAPIIEMAYGVAYRMTYNRDDAADLVQEAAVQAFRSYNTFVPGTNFKAWFFKILINCFRGVHRKRRREPEIAPLTDVPELYMYVQTTREGLDRMDNNPSALVIDRMTEEQIQAAIEALPDEYRPVAVLFLLEELSYQEIADILGCPVGTVRSRLHRGRKLLQKALRDLTESQHAISRQAAAKAKRVPTLCHRQTPTGDPAVSVTAAICSTG